MPESETMILELIQLFLSVQYIKLRKGWTIDFTSNANLCTHTNRERANDFGRERLFEKSRHVYRMIYNVKSIGLYCFYLSKIVPCSVKFQIPRYIHTCTTFAGYRCENSYSIKTTLQIKLLLFYFFYNYLHSHWWFCYYIFFLIIFIIIILIMIIILLNAIMTAN